jgi:hypothetical protein
MRLPSVDEDDAVKNLYPHKTAKRESLMQLRWRHLDHVQTMAVSDATIPELQAHLTQNFDWFFGPIRKRKRDRVPSDATREMIMVWQILNRVQERRNDVEGMAAYRAQAAADVALILAYEQSH